jgi:dolichol-phosphate mannosyltransferase
MPNTYDSASAPLVCTILPTFNEGKNITPLIERLLASVPSPYLVLVIDDDSPDGTWQVVEKLAKQYPFPASSPKEESQISAVALIRRTNERGLTSAIRRGIDEAIHTYNARIITWMDCDLSMPPEDVPLLVKAIKEGGADVAVGSRWVKGGADAAHGFMARVLSWIINTFAILLLGNKVHDYTSGFIAARAEVLQRLPIRGDYGEYCIDLLCRAGRLNYRMLEVPYICIPRTEGESKTGINLWDYLSKGFPYVTTILRLCLQRH